MVAPRVALGLLTTQEPPAADATCVSLKASIEFRFRLLAPKPNGVDSGSRLSLESARSLPPRAWRQRAALPKVFGR